jgi:CRISPR-associated protein Cas1
MVQRAVLSLVTPVAQRLFQHDSFGHRPERTVDVALAGAREQVLFDLSWVVHADLKRFSDNLPHRSLRQVLDAMIPGAGPLHTITQRLTCDCAVPESSAPGAASPMGR